MKYIFYALLLTCYTINAMENSATKYGSAMYLAKDKKNKVEYRQQGNLIFATIKTAKNQDTNVTTTVKKNTDTGEISVRCRASNVLPSLFTADDYYVTPNALVVERLKGKIAKMESGKIAK